MAVSSANELSALKERLERIRTEGEPEKNETVKLCYENCAFEPLSRVFIRCAVTKRGQALFQFESARMHRESARRAHTSEPRVQNGDSILAPDGGA
eukprot:6175124-Pleurochrysis_carterae.AAC.4